MKKIIKIIIIIIGVISIVGLTAQKIYLEKNKTNQTKEIITNEKPELLKEEPKEETATTVFIDIKGAVKKPGVYEIENNKKVIDVINLAGGLSDNADTSMINLARKVTNEMVVIIYTKEEVKEATKPNQIIKYVDKECICPQIKNDACLNTQKENTTTKNNSESQQKQEKIQEKVNINTATLEELQTLTGIGESKAKAIIEYRTEKGQFNNIEELKEVNGIGDSLYEKVKDSITI